MPLKRCQYIASKECAKCFAGNVTRDLHHYGETNKSGIGNVRVAKLVPISQTLLYNPRPTGPHFFLALKQYDQGACPDNIPKFKGEPRRHISWPIAFGTGLA